MVSAVEANKITLRDLINQFGLQRVDTDNFFLEWQTNLPELTTSDQQLLDKVRLGFLNLLDYPPMLEDSVRMAVLDPILFIGNFYLAPFEVRSEEAIELILKDEDTIVRGKIDTLILKEQLWVMVIESKRASFSVEQGLAQILAYMLARPQTDTPTFGMITTGGSFIFIKLVNGNNPQYATSKLFGTRNSGDLYDVLRILKRLIQ
ncbi:MAG: restriction endonuclease subunit R [Leptolyngbyaceae bacterium]|nr:restriction endonuclease subunit R [Leptolyngbyaceae bacterium]